MLLNSGETISIDGAEAVKSKLNRSDLLKDLKNSNIMVDFHGIFNIVVTFFKNSFEPSISRIFRSLNRSGFFIPLNMLIV
jgi:hypothetical protein